MSEKDKKIPEPRHLGDGVYISFDGYHINLAANHHENHVIALEPEVLKALDEYREYVKDFYSTTGK